MERAEQFALVARASQAREMKFPMFPMFTTRSLKVPYAFPFVPSNWSQPINPP